MIACRRTSLAVALTGVALVGCASRPGSGPDGSSGHGAWTPIVRASVGPQAASWVELADGRTVVSADAGRSWRALAAPRPPAKGASVATSGGALTVVALSGRTLTVQRSTDGGATWQARSHQLSAPAQAAEIAASADGRELAIAVASPGSAGASGGYGQLLVGPAGGSLVARPAPGGADVAWSGDRLLMPGGPLRSRLYVSADRGRTWIPRGVGGAVAPEHDVAPDVPVFGRPVASGSGAVVPVTTRSGAHTVVTLYRTSDGTRFTPTGKVKLAADIGAGVGVIASRYGSEGVIVADPSSTRLHAVVGGAEKQLAGSGLPGPVDSLSFQDATNGLAQVTVRRCAHGKSDCSEQLRVYRTSDGGASWTRTTP